MHVLMSNGELVEKPVGPSPALFRLAFRPFFLFGALFSVLCLLAWAAMLNGALVLPVYGGGLWWHVHEMLFGFVGAIVAGFLLTAVQTWTQRPSLKGLPLALLFLLWLSARILFLLPNAPPLVAFLVDVAFLPAVAAVLARLVIQAKLWRNIIFAPLLVAMAAANVYMHLSVYWHQPQYQHVSANSMVLLVTLLMCIMGGRVIPMFTASGTKTARVVDIVWLDRAALASMLLVILASMGFIPLPKVISANLFFVAAFLHGVRALRWRIWLTLKTPLVWSLHISYWCIPAGLLLAGLSEATTWVSYSQAQHTLTVGGIGTMILAMISRVSLGHTGRPLRVGRVMTLAFLALGLAFVVRVFGGTWPGAYPHAMTVAAVLWAAGYTCFVVQYFPILTRPRVDGRPG